MMSNIPIWCYFFSQDVNLDVLGALNANIGGILVKTGKCVGV